MMTSEEIDQWFVKIRQCEEFQSEQHENWKQSLLLYKGEFFGRPTDNNDDISEVNFVYEFVKLLVSAIYAKDPFIFIRTQSKKYALFAETMERAINRYWKILKMKKKIKSTVQSSVIQPPGFLEIGYLFLKESEENKTMTAKQLEEEFPELKDVKPSFMEPFGIFDDTIQDDDIFAIPRSAWNVLWPRGYHDIRESPYMVIWTKVPLLDVHNNPMFKDAKYRVKGSEIRRPRASRTQNFSFNPDGMNVNTPSFNNKDFDKENIDVKLYYVYDRRGQRRFVLAENFRESDLFLRKWKNLSEGHPVFPLIFNEIPESENEANSYPLSDIVPMLPQLKELSKLSSAMMRHRKRSGSVILVRKGGIEPSEITNLTQAGDLDIVEVSAVDDSTIKAVTPPALPSDFYRLREQILQDLFRISGFEQLLQSAKGVETATESENLRAGALLRQAEKIDIIEDYIVDIARYMMGLIWQYKSRSDISDLLGEEVSPDMWPDLPLKPDGEVDLVKARRVIQNDLFLNIEAGSTRPPKDEAVERKQWMDLIGIIKANFPGRLRDDIILPQMLKKFDFKDIDQAVIGFDKEEQQVALQESQLLLQGIPIPVSPNNNHSIHLQVMAMVMQQAGDSLTREFEEHMVAHDNYQKQLSPTVSPQKGDSRIAPQTTSPELKRRGVPENVDLLGSTRVSEVGLNKGR